MVTLKDVILCSVKRNQPARLRISQAGRECLRERYYASIGAPETEPTTDIGLMRMATGSALDKYALTDDMAVKKQILDTLFTFEGCVDGDFAFQVPVIFIYKGMQLSGTADAVIHSVTESRVADLKTVGTKTLRYAPKPEHVLQVSIYAHGLGIENWELCYYCPEKAEFTTYTGKVDKLAIMNELDRFHKVYSAIKNVEVPARPFTSDKARACTWCKYKTHCWQA